MRNLKLSLANSIYDVTDVTLFFLFCCCELCKLLNRLDTMNHSVELLNSIKPNKLGSFTLLNMQIKISTGNIRLRTSPEIWTAEILHLSINHWVDWKESPANCLLLMQLQTWSGCSIYVKTKHGCGKPIMLNFFSGQHWLSSQLSIGCCFWLVDWTSFNITVWCVSVCFTCFRILGADNFKFHHGIIPCPRLHSALRQHTE